jgi:hypothetical protein
MIKNFRIFGSSTKRFLVVNNIINSYEKIFNHIHFNFFRFDVCSGGRF